MDTQDTQKSYQDAYAEGKAVGVREERLNCTVRCLRALIRRGGMDLEAAMATLELPKAERKTYRRIFSKQLPKGSVPQKKN